LLENGDPVASRAVSIVKKYLKSDSDIFYDLLHDRTLKKKSF
jgi:hypothetical protein